MKKLKVYYAHFMGIYNTPQEKRDVETLEALGFEVLNPNTPETKEQCKREFDHVSNDEEYQRAFSVVFHPKVSQCEVFAFKALPDGRIPGGVAIELRWAQLANKLIIELPSGTYARCMGKDDTREYLRDIGQR